MQVDGKGMGYRIRHIPSLLVGPLASYLTSLSLSVLNGPFRTAMKSKMNHGFKEFSRALCIGNAQEMFLKGPDSQRNNGKSTQAPAPLR